MKNSKFFPFAEAASLAQMANLRAARVRANQETERAYSNRIQQWEQVFLLPVALFSTIVFLLLAVADSFLLGDMYRELSQMVCGNPDQLRWTIAIVVNVVAGLCSHELSRTLSQGTFFDWEVSNYEDSTPVEIARGRVAASRRYRRMGLLAMLVAFATLLSLILYIRAGLMKETGTTHSADGWIILLGLCLMGFEIIAGCYFLYFLEYFIWVVYHGILRWRNREGIRLVSKDDTDVHEIWMHIPATAVLTSDINDALYRFRWHRHDFSYCDLPDYQFDKQAASKPAFQIPSTSDFT